MTITAKPSHKKHVSKHQAQIEAARQNGKLVFWLILAVLAIGFLSIAFS